MPTLMQHSNLQYDRRRRCHMVAAAFVVLSTSCVKSETGPAFRVEGVCSMQHFDRSGRAAEMHKANFAIDVAGLRYTMKLLVEGEPDDYWQVACDGTNTYYLMVQETAIKRLRDAGTQTGENIAGGTVRRSLVPNFGSYTPAGPIWLTYASAWYFSTTTDATSPGAEGQGKLDLPSGLGTDGGMDIQEFHVRRMAAWSLLERSGLPERVAYFEPGYALRPTIPRGSYTRVQYPAPYGSGWTNTIYTVLAVTNAGGTVLPQHSALTTYAMAANGSSATTVSRKWIFDIRTERIAVFAEPLVVPPRLPGKTLVVEARFLEDPATPKVSWSYLADNAFPTDAEVRGSGAYKMAKPQPQSAVVKPMAGASPWVKRVCLGGPGADLPSAFRHFPAPI